MSVIGLLHLCVSLFGQFDGMVRLGHPGIDRDMQEGGIAVLKGNIAPDGAVIKAAAATPELMSHRGPAVVFRSARNCLSANVRIS